MRTDAPMRDGGGVDAPMSDGGGMDGPLMDGAVDGGGDGGSADGGMACWEMDLGTATGLAVATGSNEGAGDELDPSCQSTDSTDVVLRWEAPSAGTYVFDLNDSDYDTVLTLLDGDDCMGAELACDDDGGPSTQSRLVATLAAGQVVNIVIDGWDGAFGDYSLAITTAPDELMCGDTMDEDRDGNVDCDDADCETLAACVETMCTDTMDNDLDSEADCLDFDCFRDAACETCPATDIGMMVGMAVASGSTVGGTNRWESPCGGAGPDTSVEFTAPATGEYTFTTDGSDFDTVLSVIDGGCFGLEIACHDGATTSTVTVPLAMGQTVALMIDGYFTATEGNWELNVSSTAMTYAAPAAGEIVINEIMYDPSGTDPDAEWFEVYNTTASPLSLAGCIISEVATATHMITALLVPANGYAVLGRSAMASGFTPNYVYSGVALNNSGGDAVVLTCATVEIDRVAFDGGTLFPDPTNRSLSLDPGSQNATDNDAGANWCASPYRGGSYNAVDLGTPLADNPTCP
jgi:hypothetical protein